MYKISPYLLLVVLLVSFPLVYGQNNTPCGGGGATNIAVNAACTFTTGNNNSATAQTNANNGGTPSCGSMGPDVWYSFTAPASGDVTITTADVTIGDGVMALYSGSCGPTSLTELNCSDDVNGLMPEITNAALTPGNTYFIRFWGFGGATGSFDICVVDNNPGLANDTPCTATPLTVNASCTFTLGTNVGGTNSGVGNPGCASYSGGPDAWYSITVPASGAVTIETGAQGITDGGLAVYSGPCGSPTLIQCNDDGGTGSMELISLTGQTPGATLFIRVWQFGGGTGTFDICAHDNTPVLPNDDPCGATPLTVGSTCTYTTIDNTGATVTGTPGDPGCAGFPGEDVWFSMTVPAGGEINISTNSAGFDFGMAAYSGANCSTLTLLDCDDDDGPDSNPFIALTGQTPGTTIWVRVWLFGGGTGNLFDICASIPPLPGTNTDCTVPDPICSGQPITFTAQAGGTPASTVNPGNDYGCLITSPNPSWYYLDIATSGDLSIDMGANDDIDFAIWGPYVDLATAVANCDAHAVPLDCSYSTSETEQANVSGVVAGEVYVLLVTNFAATVQTISVTEGPGMTATTDCSAALPVELANFTGAKKDNEIHLNWITVSEINNSHFIVERSTDGNVWTAFDWIDGVGNSTTTTEYSAIDRNPVDGHNYYRLKQFDFDGSMTYSDIIAVTGSSVPEVKLFPNPANNNIIISASDFFTNVKVSDARGSVLVNRDYELIQQTILDLSTLKNGVYYVSITSENGTSVERLVVQH